MNLQIMSRLQSAGHRLFDRFVKRNEERKAAAKTQPMMRAVSPIETDAEIARDLATIGAEQLAADQLAYGADALPMSPLEQELADEDAGQNWVESLQIEVLESGEIRERAERVTEQRPVADLGAVGLRGL